MREGGFPAPGEAVDEGGSRATAGLRLPRPTPRTIVTSPMAAAQQTADLLGVAAQVEPALRDIDHGDWAGRSFADIHTRDPGAFARWLADPAPGAPGGETMAVLLSRVGVWMDGIDGDVLAITHPMVIRAAIGVALDLPQQALLRIDIAPLSSVTLSFNRGWRLQTLRPL
jgi:broad specificity phosphatase PhoE